MRISLAILTVFALGATSAQAATTVFPASVYQTSGTVLGAGNALGSADGLSAVILRLTRGSNLVLQMSAAASGASTVITGSRTTANSNVQIAIGEIIGGVAVFSANTALPRGFGPTYSLDLSAACATVSATGCSLIRIRVSGAPGNAFRLDGLSGVSAAPEPAAWALMMLGFGAVAWRLKKRRHHAAGERALAVQPI